MRLPQVAEGERRAAETIEPAAREMHGLVGWIFSLCRSKREERELRQKQLRLIQTLHLGGRRQLLLVECSGERFLLGGGPDNVQTIVRLQGVESSGHEEKNEVDPWH
jgi:flagellar biogenesis protein FliO